MNIHANPAHVKNAKAKYYIEWRLSTKPGLRNIHQKQKNEKLVKFEN